VYNNQIQTPHELFNYCSSNIHNITFFCDQEEQILNYKKELAELFNITDAIPGTQTYHCLKPLDSRTIIIAVTFLSTAFTTHQNNKNVKLNSTDTLVSQMILISSYITSEYDGHWWLGIVQERQDHMFYVKLMQPHGSNSNFFCSQREDCCWIEDNSVQLGIHAQSAKTG
jgi:hypothetical protein